MDWLWDVSGDVALLFFGPLLAWTACEWWRHLDRAPAWVARGPRWAVRCWIVGFLLLGVVIGGSGVYGLTGLPEPWVVGFCRAVGPMLYLLFVWIPFVHGGRQRGVRRSPVSGAAEGTTERGRKEDESAKGHVA